MMVKLEEKVSFIVQAQPEVSLTSQWLSGKIVENIENLACSGFCVRAFITDNHSANVHACHSLASLFASDCSFFY